MARRLPKNLEMLYSTFDAKRIGDILPGDTFEVDGTEFVCAYEPTSTPDRFFIVKTKPLVERYLEMARQVQGANIVELGIAEGGSTALMALAAQPRKLVAVDLEAQPLDALSEFSRRRGLDATLRPHYGIDQADRDRLAALIDAEFGGEPLDLVIDDCSHQLEPTRSSFETLFPRLRPGGLFVIEDWNADHLMREAVAGSLREALASGDESVREAVRAELAAAPDAGTAERRPLCQLAIEFFLCRAGSSGVVEDVLVDEYWITVRRGPAELDSRRFRLDDAYTDYFGLKGW